MENQIEIKNMENQNLIENQPHNKLKTLFQKS